MERMIMKEIKEWYFVSKKDVLCIVGGPYVGKTHTIREFCGYEKVCNIFFVDNIDTYEQLQMSKEHIVKGREEGKRIIIAGRYNDRERYREVFGENIDYTIINMYPVSFEEFYGTALLNGLSNSMGDFIILSKKDLLRAYMVVGGLPECVMLFFRTGNLTFVREQQRKMIGNVIEQLAKDNNTLRRRIARLLCAIGKQGLDNKAGFSFRGINKDAREREYKEALNGLIDIGVIYKIRRIGVDRQGVIRAYKLAGYDVGIYGAMSDINERQIMCEYDTYEKMYKEIFVRQELLSMNVKDEVGLFYWHKQRAKARENIIFTVGDNKENERIYVFQICRRKAKLLRSVQSFLCEYPKALPILVIMDGKGEYILQKI